MVTCHQAIDHRRHLGSPHFYSNAELDETLLTIDGPIPVLHFTNGPSKHRSDLK